MIKLMEFLQVMGSWCSWMGATTKVCSTWEKLMGLECATLLPQAASTRGSLWRGELHGKGRMTWPDGSVYEGQWDHNRRQGKNC